MRRAFSMIEAVVASAIGAVLIGALMLAYSTGTQTVGRGMQTLDVLGTCALALEHLRRDLRGLAGPLPPPIVRGAGDWSIDLLKLDGADPATGRGRYSAVRWELERGATQTRLARDQDGERTQYTFDGQVNLSIVNESAAPQVIVVKFSFPGPNGERRPPVRAVLTRQDAGAPVRLIDGMPRVPRARLLPEPDRPWGETQPVYPPDVFPRGGR